MFEKVLIPTDLSELSEKIVARTGRMNNIREIIFSISWTLGYKTGAVRI